MKTDIRIAFATIVASSALPMAAQAGAYKVTINGESQITCSASASAWKLYTAARTKITSATIEQLSNDSEENKRCIAERQAKAEAKAKEQSSR